MSAKLYSADKIEGFEPTVFMGHRRAVIAAWFGKDGKSIYTVSEDGAVAERKHKSVETGEEVEFPSKMPTKWSTPRHLYFHINEASVTSIGYNERHDMVVAGFSNGVFGLWELPSLQKIQTLSISQHVLNTAAINNSGEWLALGSSKLGQLLVWEWQSESYVLKQQGHTYDMSAAAYSGDGQYIATGGDDGKVKVWQTGTGYCFVTFSNHSASVSDVVFTKNSQVVVSASLDGTVRAFDLVRYRNFRTFAAPTPVQFSCLAVDGSGDIVCAGCKDSFEIYVWSMQTGRLLDVLSGHQGPVSALEFRSDGLQLASSSWDKTVCLWDVFTRSKAVEKLAHSFEVLSVSYRPDCKALACSTLDGSIHFWDVATGVSSGSIEGQKDIAGGRKASDLRASKNSTFGKCFTSVVYSADGKLLLGGGNTNNLCLYHVDSKALVKNFQLCNNFSFDAMLDFLNSKDMTSAGPNQLLPPSKNSHDISKRSTQKAVTSRAVRFSPSNHQFCVAASNLGLVIYSLDPTIYFDPFDIDIEITPDYIINDLLVSQNDYLKALVCSLKLGERGIIAYVYNAIPDVNQVSHYASQLPSNYILRLLSFIVSVFDEPASKIQLHLTWISCILMNSKNFSQLKANSFDFIPTLKALKKSVAKSLDEVGTLCDDNIFELNRLSTL
ncbi:Periodic tryptophan protein-like protein [Zancudomyces culisetae]|uniref:Periodic tryptophan protein-like protein n=1 Tax=Zancudomyces culisetae TaxID=1213189 RepID=A0A1R1PRL8_ZANCU|nr:Periodic tryptophan protein-like protein [Zancudomyces culisetae]|eukprot:OMH83598.1 Periodic tryptophan protein-like protein [Zancudomyces culisetae]